MFEDALGRARPQMPYYQARSTQKVTIAGVPAVVHEFSYQPNAVGVSFIGRSYTFVSGATVFTFFFQALNEYAAALAGECTKVMSTLKPVSRPAPQPAADQAANAPIQNPAARPDGGLAAEDMGLVYSLPAGWKRDDDPAGSKYRYFDTDGAPLGSLLIFKPMNSQRLMDLFGGTEDDILDAALSERVDRELKGYERYQPAATTKRKIAGYNGLVHDFTFLNQGQPVFSRWVIFGVPGKAADPTVKVAPTVQQFAFTVIGVDRVAEFKRQWDGILDSMRVKGAPVPPPPPAKNEAHMPPVPPVKPELKTEGGLPDLQADEPGPGLYAEPFGRYQVALPGGAVQVKIEENAAYYKMPAPKTGFIIHSYRQDEIGPRLAARFAEGRKL
ncbi:MAG: hypothetical protein NTZ26_15200, partial [Candidatus Aminicenantes bacterium]|nr:hypothetical protein [Candidatus Aminicenantes bacterium]